MVRRVRLLCHLSSPILQQVLWGPTFKGSTGRSGTFGQGAHSATSRPVAVSAPFKVPLCGSGCGIRLETLDADPKTVQ